jgi:hypothetical protein
MVWTSFDWPVAGNDARGIKANSVAQLMVHAKVEFGEHVGEQTQRQ